MKVSDIRNILGDSVSDEQISALANFAASEDAARREQDARRAAAIQVLSGLGVPAAAAALIAKVDAANFPAEAAAAQDYCKNEWKEFIPQPKKENGISQADFDKLPLHEKMRYINENPGLSYKIS